MHCNIKPQNVLVMQPPGGGLRGVLTDFELGQADRPGGRGRPRVSHAPEVVADWARRRTPAADVYALGVLLVQTLGGDPKPTQGSGARVNLPGDAAGDGSLCRLAGSMLNADPAARPS